MTDLRIRRFLIVLVGMLFCIPLDLALANGTVFYEAKLKLDLQDCKAAWVYEVDGKYSRAGCNVHFLQNGVFGILNQWIERDISYRIETGSELYTGLVFKITPTGYSLTAYNYPSKEDYRGFLFEFFEKYIDDFFSQLNAAGVSTTLIGRPGILRDQVRGEIQNVGPGIVIGRSYALAATDCFGNWAISHYQTYSMGICSHNRYAYKNEFMPFLREMSTYYWNGFSMKLLATLKPSGTVLQLLSWGPSKDAVDYRTHEPRISDFVNRLPAHMRDARLYTSQTYFDKKTDRYIENIKLNVLPANTSNLDLDECRQNWTWWSNGEATCDLPGAADPEKFSFIAYLDTHSKAFIVNGIPYTVTISIKNSISVVSPAGWPTFDEVKQIIQDTWAEAKQKQMYRVIIE